MKNNTKFIVLFFVLLTVIIACEKDDPDELSLEFKLTDEFGVSKSQFSQSDSLIFEFLLSNHTGTEATYLRPCSEFGNYLHIYLEDPDGDYIYFGRPEYNCAAVAVYLDIRDG